MQVCIDTGNPSNNRSIIWKQFLENKHRNPACSIWHGHTPLFLLPRSIHSFTLWKNYKWLFSLARWDYRKSWEELLIVVVNFPKHKTNFFFFEDVQFGNVIKFIPWRNVVLAKQKKNSNMQIKLKYSASVWSSIIPSEAKSLDSSNMKQYEHVCRWALYIPVFSHLPYKWRKSVGL